MKKVLFFIMSFFVVFSFSQQTNNYVLRAVPAPGKVLIDGKLDDWDLSGEILMCYDISTLLDKYSVRAAAMYDKDYFYLSFRFKDRTPLINYIDPNIEPGCGWKADSIELRMKTDIISHWETWYFTERNQPCVWVHYGMWNKNDPDYRDLPDAIKEGVKIAFLKEKDGYVEEIAIPWKLMTRNGKPLGPGEKINLGIMANWGAPSGKNWPEHRYVDLINKEHPQREFFWSNSNAWGEVIFEAKGNLPPSESIKQLSEVEKYLITLYSTEGPVKIEYEMPFDGYATLVIETKDGKRIRNLISSYPRKKGKNIDLWDGKDDNGNLVKPGEYIVRGLYHKGFDIIYQFAYGNPGDPQWLTTDDKGGWLSNHGNPMGICSDEKQIYVSAPLSEGACAVMAIDYNGKKQWGISNINGGMLAVDDKYLYMLLGPGTIGWGGPPEKEVAIRRIDKNTGRYATWSDGKDMHTIFKVDEYKGKTREPFGKVYEEKAFDADWLNRDTMGLTYFKNNLYATLYFENKVIVVDPVEGKTIKEIDVEKPCGITNDGENIYLISGKRVLSLDEKGNIEELVRTGLDAPVGIAVDKNGNIYVSDLGKSMCVKVFNKSGKLIRTIGKVGGRKIDGKYDPNGMFLPWSITVDKNDRLWVIESWTSPRRISVWDIKTGKFLKEFCGTTYYASAGAHINNLDPTQGFVLNNIVEIDWKKGKWRVTGTLPTYPRTKEELLNYHAGHGFNGYERVINYKGRKLLIQSGGFGFVIMELYKDSAKPLSACGYGLALFVGGERMHDIVLKNLTGGDMKKLEELKNRFPKAFNGGNLYDWANVLNQPGIKCNFIWVDMNGDGYQQENEFQFFSKEEVDGARLTSGWQFPVDPNTLDAYCYGGKDGNLAIWKIPCKGFNKYGVPIYDYKDIKIIASEKPIYFGDSFGWADNKGNILVGQHPLMMFSPDGKLLWTYPNPWPGVHGSHTAPQSKLGRIIGPLYVLGSADLEGVGEIFCLSGNLGERYLMTTDGLFIGNLFKDCRAAPDSLPDKPERGMIINDCTAGGEPFGGGFFKNPLDGKIYIEGPVGSCREASLVAEIKGVENIKRFPDIKITFTEAQYNEAVKLIEKKAEEEKKEIKISKANKPFGFNWQKGYFSEFRFDAKHSARATWTYDDKNLYVAFDVVDDTPMINNGTDWMTLFKTGDAVEFDLRTKPDDDSKNVIQGDIRILVSVFGEKPIAVLYNYKVPGTEKPVEFKMTGKTVVDLVKIIESAKINLTKRADGYRIEFSMPLSEINFAPEKGKRYKGDFGVVYSDKTGKINELRMYWCDPTGSMVNDIGLEAGIQPRFWGNFIVE